MQFVITTFLSFQICSLLRGGIAERGGVRVGHRIIEINGQSVVAVPHERIVNLLATSVGEVGFKISVKYCLFRVLNIFTNISKYFITDTHEDNANIHV